MRQNSWSSDGLDPETREAAREAARRAGMTLDEWIAATLSERAPRNYGDPPPVRRRSTADELEAAAAKLARVTRGRQTGGRDYEGVISAAALESERRHRENTNKTAHALDSVARWIERADERLTETTRAASELSRAAGETSRAAIERQERTTAVVGEALSLMTRRLEEIERRVAEGQQTSVAAALKAIETVEQRFAQADEVRDRTQAAQIETALKTVEARMAQLGERLTAASQRAPARRALSPQDEIRQAIAEIRSRQTELGAEPTSAPLRGNMRSPEAAKQASDARAEADLLLSIKQDIARLAGQVETGRQPAPDPVAPVVGAVKSEIERLQGSLAGLATRAEVSAIEGAIRSLAGHLARGEERDDIESLTGPLEALQGEVARLSETFAGGVHERLASEFEGLAGKIDKVATLGASQATLEGLSRQLAELRSAFGALADPYRVERLSEQLSELSRQVGQLGRSQVDVLEFASLRAAVEDIRTAVKTPKSEGRDLLRELERVHSKLEEMSERAPQGDMDVVADQFAFIAGKLNELSSAGSARDPGLAREIERLGDRLDGALARQTGPQFDPILERLDRLQQDLRQPSAEAAIAPIGKVLDKLERIEEGLRQSPSVGAPVSDVLRKLERIEEGLRQPAALTAPVADVLQKLERIEESLRKPAQVTALPPFETVLEKLERLDRRFEEQTPALPLDKLFSKLDRIDETLHRPEARGDLKPIEDLLRSLADKLDHAERPGADGDSLDALERQVSDIAARLDRSAGGDPAIASLERTMSDLLRQVETLREGASATAERAAKAALASTLGALPKSGGPEMGALKREFAELKAHYSASDKRTHQTLEAVHATLEKVASRLASLDQNRAPTAVAGPIPARTPTASRLEETVRQLQASVGASPATPPEADRPVAGPADEILLDPGAERPRPTAQPSAEGATASDIKASFIAAARRAAQAAAAEAASQDKASGRSPEALLADLDGHGEGLAIRLKRNLATQRRPLLLGLAAIVLALGTLKMLAGFGDAPQMASAPALTAPAPTSLASAAQRQIPAADIVGTPAATGPGERAPAEPARLAEATPPSSSEAKPEARPAAVPSAPPPAIAAAGQPSMTGSIAPLPSEFERIPNMGAMEIPASINPAGLRQAALAGNPAAVYEIAARMAEGRGAPRDLKLAGKLFEKAAAFGLAPAQFRIGNQYEKGLGVPKDLALAKAWYTRAAEKGNVRAMHNLAVLMAEGAGGKPDYPAAVEWFRRAAEHGVRDSQYNLAVLLARGLGSAQDLSASYLWFAVAAGQGDEDAGKKRDEVAARLSQGDLARAKTAVERWRPSAPERVANEISAPAQGWSEAPADKKAADNARS